MNLLSPLTFNSRPAEQDFLPGRQYEVPEWFRALVDAERGIVLPAVITCKDAGERRDWRMVHEPEKFESTEGTYWVQPGEVVPAEKYPPCFHFRSGWRIVQIRIDLPASIEDPELRVTVAQWTAKLRKERTQAGSGRSQVVSKQKPEPKERKPSAKVAKVDALLESIDF